jgi:uncharacterized protein YacL
MIHIIRALFIIVVAVAAWAFIWSTLSSGNPIEPGATTKTAIPFNPTPYLIMFGAVIVTFAVNTIDVLAKRKNLAALSGLMFGILVGVLISLCLSALIDQIANSFLIRSTRGIRDAVEMAAAEAANESLLSVLHGIKLLLGIIVTYITTSFVLQTKDDFRFIIPYVEFQRATKGPRPIILDTSVIIDGRIADMAATGLFETTILVPRFVLNELQTIADSSDRLKRARGRRGLEVLEKLKGLPRLELRFWDGTLTSTAASTEDGVDQKLVSLAQQENGRIVTNDYNLNKVAGLRGVNVININQIADALKPVVLPGETMRVRVVKPGENAGQGVGYLEDGTMVVVEGGRDKVGAEVDLVVTNMIQNPAGKMIFGRTDTTGHVPAPRPNDPPSNRRAG